MKNESGLVFTDISSERYRKYFWSNGYEKHVSNPTHLHVSESGGHRILDGSGTSHYIKPGWAHLEWEVHEGQANFVK